MCCNDCVRDLSVVNKRSSLLCRMCGALRGRRQCAVLGMLLCVECVVVVPYAGGVRGYPPPEPPAGALPLDPKWMSLCAMCFLIMPRSPPIEPLPKNVLYSVCNP